VIGQFAPEYLKTLCLHAGHINYVLHKTTIASKLDYAETRNSV